MKHTVKYFLFFILLICSNNTFSKQNTIKNIRTSDKADNVTTRIVLDLSQKTAYSVFTLDNNPRLVIDLEANENKEIYELKSKIVSKVRISNKLPGHPSTFGSFMRFFPIYDKIVSMFVSVNSRYPLNPLQKYILETWEEDPEKKLLSLLPFHWL